MAFLSVLFLAAAGTAYFLWDGGIVADIIGIVCCLTGLLTLAAGLKKGKKARGPRSESNFSGEKQGQEQLVLESVPSRWIYLPLVPNAPSPDYEQADQYLQSGDYRSAVKYYYRAIEALDHSGPFYAVDLVRIRWYMGLAYKQLKDYEQAVAGLEGVLQACETVESLSTDEMLELHLQIIESRLDWGKLKDAQDAWKRAYEWYAGLKQTKKPQLARLYQMQAGIYFVAGNFKESAAFCKSALSCYNPPLPDEIVRMAEIEFYQGRAMLQYNVVQAHAHLQEAYERAKGKKVWLDGLLHYGLGEVLRRQYKYREAEESLKRAKGLQQNSKCWNIADTCLSLALLYLEQVRYDLAGKEAEEAVKIQEKNRGIYHLETARCYSVLGRIIAEAGDNLNRARRLLQDAEQVQQTALGALHPDLATTYLNLGVYNGKIGEVRAAEDYLSKAEKAFLHIYPEDHPAFIDLYREQALLCLRESPNVSIGHLENVARIMAEVDHPQLVDTYVQIADLMNQQKNGKGAAKSYGKAIAICENDRWTDRTFLAGLYEKRGYAYLNFDAPRANRDLEDAYHYQGSKGASTAFCEKMIQTCHQGVNMSFWYDEWHAHTGESHPLQLERYCKEGEACFAREQYDRAEEWFQRAADLCKPGSKRQQEIDGWRLHAEEKFRERYVLNS